MTLGEDERKELIKHRCEKSLEMVREVQEQIDNGHFNTAVNRTYYAVFHIISALAVKNNFQTSKHYQLLGWFNREYIKTGSLDKKYGKIAYDAFDMRSRGDYDDFTSYDKVDAERLYSEVKDLVEVVVQMVLK